MILLVDNNDSFSYNVVQMLRGVTDQRIVVLKSREVLLDEIAAFERIVFSPGAGLPSDYSVMGEILVRYDDRIPILGICLGHQAICQYYGGRLANMERVAHGVASKIVCDNRSTLFRGISEMIVGRYHSWVVDEVPSSLKTVARLETGEIMGVEHRTKRVFGVQCHPESYITQRGEQIFKNFIDAIP